MSFVAERSVEALADTVEMTEYLGEIAAEHLDALGDQTHLPLELRLLAVQGRPLDVDHAAEAADQIDERVEPRDRAREVVVRVCERRTDLRHARFESSQSLGQEIARLGRFGRGHWK
jgi:hypothetical protein